MIKCAPAGWKFALRVVFLISAVSLTRAQLPEQTGILRPTDQSILEGEQVQIIARSGELWLDGESLRERQAPATRQAFSIKVPSGRHVLMWKEGEAVQTIRFIVTTSGNVAVPPGWRVYRAHPPQAECDNCHAGENPGDLKKLTVVETCATCHESTTFAAVHAHQEEVLAECVLCHDPHGSTAKFHLKMSRETACKQCHG